MAMSDYLTSDEWDACFYASMGQHGGTNFSESMHKTIDALLATGYRFAGLDEYGDKQEQILGTGNPQKLCGLFGFESWDSMQSLENGRRFLKEHLPELVDETDEEWQKQTSNASGVSS